MNNLREQHIALGGQSLSWLLARHIYTIGHGGRIAIVTDRPSALLSSTRKQWLRLLRRMQCKRSSTIVNSRKKELDDRMLWMKQVTFASRVPDDFLEADVTFATAGDFVRMPPMCQYVFITCDVEPVRLHMLTSWLPENAEVVIYG